MRANTGGNADNLPPGSTFRVSASLNDHGQIAAGVNTVGATLSAVIFFGGHGVGALVRDAGDNEATFRPRIH